MFCTPKVSVMEKQSQHAYGDPHVKEVMKRLLMDLNHVPNKVAKVALTEQPKDEVPPPPDFYIDLRISKEDMEKYKVGGSLPVSNDDHIKFLGFGNGVYTQMFVRNKKVRLCAKAARALGRSWFKEGITEKDQCATKDLDKEEEKDDADLFIAKEMLQQFLKTAKAHARIARKKGKKVQEKKVQDKVQEKKVQDKVQEKKVQKQVRSTSAPHRGKKKPKFRSLNEIMSSNEFRV